MSRRHLEGWVGIALAAASVGCWSSTAPFTKAEAEPDRTGFGLARHTYSVYLVIAGASQTVTSVGHAAIADPWDSIWEVYGGGKKLQHCFYDGRARIECQRASFGEKSTAMMGDPLILVEPDNLGGALVRTTTSGGGKTTNQVSGFVMHPEARLRPTSARGVWVRSQGTGYFHCQIEGGRPICNAVPIASLPGLRALGVFTIGETDVLWVQSLTNLFAGKNEIVRCTAGPKQPVPACATAEMR